MCLVLRILRAISPRKLTARAVYFLSEMMMMDILSHEMGLSESVQLFMEIDIDMNDNNKTVVDHASNLTGEFYDKG